MLGYGHLRHRAGIWVRRRVTRSDQTRRRQDACMDVAELVLEYIRVLAWPIVVAGVLVAFRAQIGGKIASLSRVSTPIGDADFDRDAKDVEELADRAAARQDRQVQPDTESIEDNTEAEHVSSPDEPATSIDDGPEARTSGTATAGGRHSGDDANSIALRDRQMAALLLAINAIGSPPDFGIARSVSMQSPSAAIMLAYAELEKVGRAAMTITDMEQPAALRNLTSIVKSLTRTGLEVEFVQVARELTELRNRVTHGGSGDEISRTGALDFVAACERLAEALIGNATSKLRHPSRHEVLSELQSFMNTWSRPEPSAGGREGVADRD